MALSTRTFGVIVLFLLLLFITIFTKALLVDGFWWKSGGSDSGHNAAAFILANNGNSKATETAVDNSLLCGRPTGMYIENKSGSNVENIDCSKACGNHNFRSVLVTDDIFIDGERPPRKGVYCVRKTASVTRCNTITSKLVRSVNNGKWSCQPLWPAIFGGSDGGDILVCGGKLTDGDRTYEYRLPPSSQMQPITDPYAEVDRFKCTPGEYFGGPRDYMNNEYLPLDTNRFQRIRNNCAKYVANAIGVVGPVRRGDSVYCNCLPTHGRLRRADRNADEERGHRVKRDQEGEETKASVFQVPYACCPCVASGDLLSTEGIFNFPVRCTKSNQRYFANIGWIDKQPCGDGNFTSASKPPCLNTWIYVGDQDSSYAFKKALNGM